MGTSSKELARKLRKLADRQHGCFTAAQAIETGYADSVHLYHVNNGEWIRVFRGIYRFSDVPATPAARCMAALLWTRGKNGMIQGVLMAETAAALRNGSLSDRQPVQVVVPKGFRRSSKVPPEIHIFIGKQKNHKTSKINGLPAMASDVTYFNKNELGQSGLDMPDYYDWIDYQAVLCSPTP